MSLMSTLPLMVSGFSFYGYRGVAYGKGRAQHIDIDGGFVKLQIAIQLRMVAVTADIHAPVESA